MTPTLTAACACGQVELQAVGKPILTAVCYCQDCRRGAEELEALPGAPALRDADGGTACILYRKDRFACVGGADKLKSYKLKPASPTNRVVATCCNTALFVNFDRGPHWVSAYRTRFSGELPPVQMRVCTRSKADGVALPDDVPSSLGYPVGMIVRLLASRVAMMVGS